MTKKKIASTSKFIVYISDILSHLDQLEIQYEFLGDSHIQIESANSVEQAQSNQFCYFAQNKLKKLLTKSQAGFLIAGQNFQSDFAPHIKNLVLVKNPHYVFAKVMQFYYLEKPLGQSIDSSAIIDKGFQTPSTVNIAPLVVIHKGVAIGENCAIGAGSVIDENVTLGNRCRIGANVVIHKNCVIGDDVIIESGTVIGGDGFGWAFDAQQWHKIPQIGRVVIGDRVSIGNNCCIDRGAIDDTVIESDVIIDNLVHIAHNVVIGQGSAIAGQVGFAGTTKLGKFNIVAGQAGFAGHLSTVDHCQFNAKAGITNSVLESGVYAGFPIQDLRKWQRNTVKSTQLDEMSKQIKQLQQTVMQLQQSLQEES